MKRQSINKIAGFLLLAVMTALSVISLMSLVAPDIMEPILALIGYGSSGMMVANTAIHGTQTFEETNTKSPGHLKRSVSQIVTEMKPDDYPLDTMLRSIRKSEKIGNVKHEYETVKYRERESALTAAFTAEASSADEIAELTVSNIGIWGIDDTAYIPSITGADGKELRVLVMAVNRSTNKITVTAINSPTASSQRVPTIANATKIYRMATAKDETASVTDVIAQEPTQEFNYCQIHMAYLEQSVLRSLHKSESGYAYKDKYLQEVYNMRASAEFATLYGVKGRTINRLDPKKIHYTSDGIKQKITNTHTFKGDSTTSQAIAPKDVTALLEKVFAGNDGSSERLLLAGSTAIRHLQDVKLEKHIGPTQVKVVHGVSVTRLESNFGVLNIKHSKAMDQFGDKELGLVLDLKHIYKHDLEKLHSTKIDPDKAGTKRVKDAVRILENFCVTTRYPDVHLIWKRDASNSIGA